MGDGSFAPTNVSVLPFRFPPITVIERLLRASAFEHSDRPVERQKSVRSSRSGFSQNPINLHS